MYYLVTMHRRGELNSHSYNIGCFTKESRAIEIGKWESEFRGGKYESVITVVDELPDDVNLNIVDDELKSFIERFSKFYK